MEHFLECHRHALEFFGGTPGVILIDNLKTGVLSHPHGERARFHPRYLDFAAHCGFEPRACNVRKANEKGRVENFVGYIKKNFLSGLELPGSLAALNTAARQWLGHHRQRPPPRRNPPASRRTLCRPRKARPAPPATPAP